MSPIMSPEERQAAKNRCDSASIGDGSIGDKGWAVGIAGRANIVRSDDRNILAVAQVFRDADAEFVAYARTDLPRALATIDIWERYALALEQVYRYRLDTPDTREELLESWNQLRREGLLT